MKRTILFISLVFIVSILYKTTDAQVVFDKKYFIPDHGSGSIDKMIKEDFQVRIPGTTSYYSEVWGGKEAFILTVNSLTGYYENSFHYFSEEYELTTKDLIKTTDGGYALLCKINGFDIYHPKYGSVVIKLNSNFDIEWAKYYSQVLGSRITQNTYREYLIWGEYGNEIFLVRTNQYGDIASARSMSTPMITHKITEVNPTLDRGFVISGYSKNGSNYFGFILKTDKRGYVQWFHQFQQGTATILNDAIQHDNQYIYCVGRMMDHYSGQYGIMGLYIIDSNNGSIVDYFNYYEQDILYNPTQITYNPDNGQLYITGLRDDYTGGTFSTQNSAFILNAEAGGINISQRKWEWNNINKGFSGIIFNQNEIYTLGYITSLLEPNEGNIWLQKLGSNMESGCNSEFHFNMEKFIILNGYELSSSNIEIGSEPIEILMSDAGWIDENQCGAFYRTSGLADDTYEKHSIIYPNPSSGIFEISNEESYNKVQIYNTIGELVYEKTLDLSPSQSVNTKELSNGIYNCVFTNAQSNKTETVKLLISK